MFGSYPKSHFIITNRNLGCSNIGETTHNNQKSSRMWGINLGNDSTSEFTSSFQEHDTVFSVQQGISVVMGGLNGLRNAEP